jgi:glycosyltransferase involved in cell wall biosynthesis
MKKLSICIPTFNRSSNLHNCLESSRISAKRIKTPDFFEVCISNNCSTDSTAEIINKYLGVLPIVYSQNSKNIGGAGNVLQVVSMCSGEFAWIVGDDDLILPDALDMVENYLKQHHDVDYFYLNSYHLHKEYLLQFGRPFNTNFLPKKMEIFSHETISHKLNFFDLIEPRYSIDYLGGIYLSLFRVKLWQDNLDAVCMSDVLEHGTFSTFSNTFPHIQIFAKAFNKSKAYFSSTPATVNLSGVREWVSYGPYLMSFRIVEALDYYRLSGLPLLQYIKCKNYSLRYAIPDLILMFLNPSTSGFRNLRIRDFPFSYFLYPNFYLSIIYLVLRKLGLNF